MPSSVKHCLNTADPTEKNVIGDQNPEKKVVYQKDHYTNVYK